MNPTDFSGHKVLGRTGLEVSRMGLAAGYGISAKAVEKAFHEFGVNYFYWVTRKPGMREALGRILATHRQKAVVAIQSYDHLGFWLRRSVEETLQDLPDERPGLTTYTATRWGRLLNPRKMPSGERPLTAAECYRFVLSHPAVDLCLAGPKNEKEMEEGLAALRQGPTYRRLSA